jgi:hypothetical protein
MNEWTLQLHHRVRACIDIVMLAGNSQLIPLIVPANASPVLLKLAVHAHHGFSHEVERVGGRNEREQSVGHVLVVQHLGREGRGEAGGQ